MSRVKEFKLPDLGEGLTEGEILKWLVAPGERVKLNQPIVEVETAKAAVEIPSPYAGAVIELYHPEGSTVEVGAPLIAFDTDPDAGPLPTPPASGENGAGAEGGAAGGRTPVLVGYGPRQGSARRRPRRGTQARAEAPGATGDTAAAFPAQPSVPAPPAETTPAVPSGPATAVGSGNGTRPVAGLGTLVEPGTPAPPRRPAPALAKPPVRKLAKELGVDLHSLVGTGPGGSITREDVRAAAERASQQVPGPGPAEWGPNRERRIPVKGVRKHTAENMVRSAFTAPHVTEFLTVDVTRTVRACKRLRSMPDWQDIRVSPLLLVAKAVLVALRRHPMINSSWDAERGEIVVKEYVNLGIAAATDRGLIVPNIKDAGRLSTRELAQALNDLVTTARQGRTTPADMMGGTFTITNIGVFGIDTGTPILPPGEAAILAFGAIQKRPWIHKGKVRPRQVTTLGLSFDHRIIDGELGSRFLHDVGRFLTDPETALLAWD